MSPNKRIVLNIIATYGRSVYAMVLGIFTARWVLEALGETDFGLYGVIGGFAAFIVFFNDILASAISRYFAFYIGRAKLTTGNGNGDESGIEECRRWFSVAVVIHTLLPIVSTSTSDLNLKFAELVNANFDLRDRIFHVAEENRRMVMTARSVGASAKFAGSGGAIVGTYEDDAQFAALVHALGTIGCKTFRPTIATNDESPEIRSAAANWRNS